MSTYSEFPEGTKPRKVQASPMTLVDGILNILWSIILPIIVVTFIITGAIATLGIGLFLVPLAFIVLIPAIFSFVVGIFEIIADVKLLKNPPRTVKIKAIAILEIVNILSGALPSLVVGILDLVFYNEPEVKNYIDSLPA